MKTKLHPEILAEYITYYQFLILFEKFVPSQLIKENIQRIRPNMLGNFRMPSDFQKIY